MDLQTLFSSIDGYTYLGCTSHGDNYERHSFRADINDDTLDIYLLRRIGLIEDLLIFSPLCARIFDASLMYQMLANNHSNSPTQFMCYNFGSDYEIEYFIYGGSIPNEHFHPDVILGALEGILAYAGMIKMYLPDNAETFFDERLLTGELEAAISTTDADNVIRDVTFGKESPSNTHARQPAFYSHASILSMDGIECIGRLTSQAIGINGDVVRANGLQIGYTPAGDRLPEYWLIMDRLDSSNSFQIFYFFEANIEGRPEVGLSSVITMDQAYELLPLIDEGTGTKHIY